MKFYLAGKIPKGKELEDYIDWREEYEKTLSVNLENVEIFNPDKTSANGIRTEKDFDFWFGHDCWMIREVDIVIVNAEQKLGVGTSQEMLIAKYFNKPVITVLPKNTHHRKTLNLRTGFVDDWIHPFIEATSDVIIEKIDDSINFIKNIDKENIKKLNIIDSSIEYYLDIMETSPKKEKEKRF